MYKVVWFARFRDGLERDAARRHWREVHAPFAHGIPQIEIYIQSHATRALGAVGISDDPLGFDGYSCCWYRDEEAFLESLRAPDWAGMSADAPTGVVNVMAGPPPANRLRCRR